MIRSGFAGALAAATLVAARAACGSPPTADPLSLAYEELQRHSHRLTITDLGSDGRARGKPTHFEFQPPDRSRQWSEETLAGFPAIGEMITVGERVAYRVVSPAFDAHLEKAKAAERARLLASAAGGLRQILAAGPWAPFVALQQVAGSARAARAAAQDDPMAAYGRWTCAKSPLAGIDLTQAAASPPEGQETVEALGEQLLDGERVLVYRHTATSPAGTVRSTSYLLPDHLTRRMEQEFIWPAATAKALSESGSLSLWEYSDFDAPIRIDFPPCEIDD